MPKPASESTFLETIQALEKEYQNKLPPVDRWNPDLNGDMDMRIDREGRWFHQGGEIKRYAMVKMFSTILKKEGDDYFLLTPVEKWRICVDVAPFIINSLEVKEEQGQQLLLMTTNVGNQFVLGEQHPLWLEQADDGSPLPMVLVRGNLEGLISRPVYYQLADLAQEQEGAYRVFSQGQSFTIG